MKFRYEIYQYLGLTILVVLIYKFIDKQSLIGVIQNLLPGREAGIVEGIVLGSKEGMSRDYYEKLINSGLVHMVVASGANLILISRFLIDKLAGFLGRKKAVVLGLAGMWKYALMLGMEAPIFRGVVFLSLANLAILLGRKFDWWRGTMVGVVILFLLDWEIFSSMSFWLSLVAFVAINQPRPKWLEWERSKIPGMKIGAESLWVNLWLWPILALGVGKIGVMGIVGSVLVTGVVEIISVLGMAGVVVGLINLEVARLVLWLLLPSLKFFDGVVELTSRVPLWEVKFNWAILVGYYLIGFYLLRWGKKLWV